MTDPKHKQSNSLREPRPKKKLGLTVPQPLRMPHEELVWRMKMTRAELVETVNQDAENRIREGVKAVIEQILEEEMTAHIGAARRERSPLRRDERNGHYERDLITPVGRVEQLRVLRARRGESLTEVFDRYQRITGNVEEAALEMYLQGVSTREAAAITDALSGVRVGKDAVSRIATRLDEELRGWRHLLTQLSELLLISLASDL